MKKFKLGLILFSVILLLVNCSNDENGPYFAPPTASGFKSIKDAALAGLVQKTTFKAEDGINFTSAKGVKLNIYGGCLYTNGSQVTGNVDLEFIELFDRGNMLVSNKPLMGKD
ncbi:MAG: hypothetical protein LBN74_10415, partial [Prevotella sp.]|nr:hypothetical protein [Prevotella sp.]